MLRDGRQYVERELIGLWEVHSLELDTGLHKVRNECDVPREPVQLCDDQNSPMEAAGCKGFRKPWPVCTSSRFYLGIFGDQLSGSA
jgi:hypothetical protein